MSQLEQVRQAIAHGPEAAGAAGSYFIPSRCSSKSGGRLDETGQQQEQQASGAAQGLGQGLGSLASFVKATTVVHVGSGVFDFETRSLAD